MAFVEDCYCLRLAFIREAITTRILRKSGRPSVVRAISETIRLSLVQRREHVKNSTKVSPYRDVVKKEGLVVKEEDQLALDVKGSGRNVVMEQSWGDPKVKNVGGSLVKLVANASNDVAGDERTLPWKR
ncbi:hypothetical protein IGI04_019516 [Brassica rapa subsp. trilocularis]|uniref:Uncharacterized protein n=1 Tax=Brassica rapa subsp. trilocularis TaxID=1813537 RepID=A0ABQ7MG26_BRACM|nr:hypothetical protein IGI04_019516 [Brassica rapa subsp. trilocularis]